MTMQMKAKQNKIKVAVYSRSSTQNTNNRWF